MRRRKKMQILDLLLTVQEALQYIKHSENQDEKEILNDCAWSIRSIVNAFAAEEAGIAASLRKLGERIEKAAAPLCGRQTVRKEAAALLERLDFVRRRIETLTCQLEVVFLPYKAAMWDSFESIWRAADADPLCDAYVMPIPHCDLNPNRTPAHIYDESHLFPAEVPITDYRTYDLAEHHPDVIYFHNPYDGHNRVTSVLPHFYSDKLKQYTDLLVYVPYFVSVDTIGEQLCRTSGSYNADLIIAPSEKIKEAYLKYHAPEKIAVLGTPQFDAVRWAHEHRPPIPKEWQEIAKGRKLILYNTHLSPLFIDNGSVCRKLRYVFSCFKGRDDVCLLWRPHPLSIATMKAMNRKPLQEYLDLVKSFKESKLGIYDDSADVHRAIELSAAYYGDHSSLVDMYGVTGKPIMMQDVELCKKECEDRYRYIPFSDAVFDGNTMWFTSAYGNMLFKMDLGTEKVDFVGQFPGEADRPWLYSKIVKVEKRLFFIPAIASAIFEYDTETLRFKEHSIVEYLQTLSPAGVFRSAFLHKEWIYCIPNVGKEVLRIHVNAGVIEVYRGWYQDLQQYVVDEKSSLFADMLQIDNFVWCPFRQGNKLVRFDLETMQVALYEVGEEGNSYFSITFDGNKFWLMENDGRTLISWDPLTKHTNTYPLLSKKSDLQQQSLGWCAYLHGYIWVFPLLGNKLIKFHIKTEKAEQVKNIPDDFSYIAGARFELRFGGVQAHEECIVAFPMGSNRMLQIDGKKGVIHGKKVCFSIMRQIEILKNIIYREGTHCTCNSFFEYIGKFDFDEENFSGKTVVSESCGEVIHHDVLRRSQR